MAEFIVKFSRSFQHGGETITIGGDWPVHVQDGEKPQPFMLIRLSEADRWVDECIKSYKDAHPVTASPAATRSKFVDEDGAQIRIVALDKLGINVSKGVKSYKCFGGEYQQWGVNLYPELIIATWGKLPDADVDMIGRGWKMHIELKSDGKPRKVVKLVRDE